MTVEMATGLRGGDPAAPPRGRRHDRHGHGARTSERRPAARPRAGRRGGRPGGGRRGAAGGPAPASRRAAAGRLGVATVALAAAGVRWSPCSPAPLGRDRLRRRRRARARASTGLAAVVLPAVLIVARWCCSSPPATAETRERRFTRADAALHLRGGAAHRAGHEPAHAAAGVGGDGRGVVRPDRLPLAEARRVASGADRVPHDPRRRPRPVPRRPAAALAGGSRPLARPRCRTSTAAGATWPPPGSLVAALGKAAQLPFSFWLARAMDGPSPVVGAAALRGDGRPGRLPAAAGRPAAGRHRVGRRRRGLGRRRHRGRCSARSPSSSVTSSSCSPPPPPPSSGSWCSPPGSARRAAGTAHLVAHAAVKALLFLAAGAWLEALGTKQLAALTGRGAPLARCSARSPRRALLALAGLPPLSLWATKDAVLAAALEHSPALYARRAGRPRRSPAAYAVRALVVLLGPVPTRGHAERPASTRRSRAPARSSAGCCSRSRRWPSGAVALGLLVVPAVLEALPGAVPAEPAAWELVVSGLVVVAVGALVPGGRPAGRTTAPGSPAGRGGCGPGSVSSALVVAGDRAAGRPRSRRLPPGSTTGCWRAAIDLAASGRVGAAAPPAPRRRGLSRRRLRGGEHGSPRGPAGAPDSATGQLHHYYLQLVARCSRPPRWPSSCSSKPR